MAWGLWGVGRFESSVEIYRNPECWFCVQRECQVDSPHRKHPGCRNTFSPNKGLGVRVYVLVFGLRVLGLFWLRLGPALAFQSPNTAEAPNTLANPMPC